MASESEARELAVIVEKRRRKRKPIIARVLMRWQIAA